MNSRDRLIAVLERHEPDYVPIVLQSVISSRVSDELMKATGQNGRRGSTSPSVGITYRMYREFVDKLIKSNPSNWKEEFTKVANMVAVTPIDINLYTKLGVDGFFHAASNGRVRYWTKTMLSMSSVRFRNSVMQTANSCNGIMTGTSRRLNSVTNGNSRYLDQIELSPTRRH